MIFAEDNLFLLLNIQDRIHLQPLFLELQCGSFYIYIIIMSLRPFLYPNLWMMRPQWLLTIICVYNMPFLLSRIENLLFSIICRSWYLLFCGIYERQKAWKILFNLVMGSEPFGNVVYLFLELVNSF